MISKAEHRSPWLFIPTLAFALGIPITIITQVATMMYSSLGMSNQLIGVLSLLSMPVALNVFFAPFVDSWGTKRNWIIVTQFILVACLLSLSLCMLLNFHAIGISIVLVAVVALAAGVFAVPGAGFYVDALKKEEQGFFVGINTASIRIAIIFTTGVLVIISGKFAERVDNLYHGWSLFYGMCAAVVLITAVWHWLVMPFPTAVKKTEKQVYFPCVPYRKRQFIPRHNHFSRDGAAKYRLGGIRIYKRFCSERGWIYNALYTKYSVFDNGDYTFNYAVEKTRHLT